MAITIAKILNKFHSRRARTALPTKTVYSNNLFTPKCVAIVWSFHGTLLKGEIIKTKASVYTYKVSAQYDETIYTGERQVFWAPIDDKTASFYDTPRKALEKIYRIFDELQITRK